MAENTLFKVLFNYYITEPEHIAVYPQTVIFSPPCSQVWSHLVVIWKWKCCMILPRCVLKMEGVCPIMSFLYLAAWNLNVITRATSSDHIESRTSRSFPKELWTVSWKESETLMMGGGEAICFLFWYWQRKRPMIFEPYILCLFSVLGPA